MRLIAAICLLVVLFVSPAVAVSWEFNSGADGWWAGGYVTGLTSSGGWLIGNVSGIDPQIIGATSPKIDATNDKYLQVKMRVAKGTVAEFFWLTPTYPSWHSDRKVKFDLMADGEFHDYVVDMSVNPYWQGQIDALRFDMTNADSGKFEIDYIRSLPTGLPVLEANDPSTKHRFAFAGQPFYISTKVRNTGTAVATNIQATISASGQTVLTSQPQVIGSLNPGAETTLTWLVQANNQQVSDVTLTVTPASPGIGRTETSRIMVSKARPAVPSQAPPEAQAWTDAEQNAIIENGKVRMVFIKSDYGYTVGELYVRNGDAWSLVAASAPLSRAGYMRPSKVLGAVTFIPTSATASDTPQGAQLQLPFSVYDADSGQWSGQITYSLGDNDDMIKAQFSLSCNTTRSLTEWVGPSLCFGNYSTGSAKSQALFPGLEWLAAGEQSSNTLEASPPLNLRVVPHPYKVTVPLMAVSGNGNLVAVLWNQLQSWAGSNKYLNAKFSSPNWFEGQDNHLMELFVPSIPVYAQENATNAGVFYPLIAGVQLNMEGYYLARRGGEVLDAVDQWYSLFGMPSQPGEAAILESGLEASRTSLMTQLWNASRKGWPAVVGWDANPYTEYTADLFAHALIEQDPTVKAATLSRANEAMQQALSWWGQSGLGANGGSYINDYRLPYYAGYLSSLPGRMSSDANSIRSSQQADGGWFVPVTEWSISGTKELGSCAEKAYRLLRHARVSGDTNSRTAGLNALSFMNSFVIPRGGQVWEVPQHAPDIIPAAWAVGAYLEGYAITGDTQYLTKARYWAKAGLPFVYGWKAPERDIMNYATIPVFGATHYIAPWFGIPVQWCGMVYAYHIERLADYDKSMHWRSIAEGITRSCIQQMRIGTVPGAYPDALNLMTNNPSSPYIIPDVIYKMTLHLLGKYHEINVREVVGPSKTARISTAGKIRTGSYSTNGNQLSFKVSYPTSETCNILIFGTGLPVSVYKGSQQLTKYSSVNTVPEGWYYNSTSNFIVIKAIQASDEQAYRVVISGTPAPVNDVNSPAEAKGLPESSIVALSGLVSAGTQDFGRNIYMQSDDRASGVRVSLAADPLIPIAEGDRVEVMGNLTTSLGERVISGADVRSLH